MTSTFRSDSQIRREAIAAALTWKLAAPELRRRATSAPTFEAYQRQVAQINATVRSRVRQARIMGAQVAY